MSIKNTNAMDVSNKSNSPKAHITIDGQHIEQVKSCMYLGFFVTEMGDPKRRSREEQ